MSSDIKSVEDSIKIALDAADVATNVTDEFARITKDYSAVESEVKKVYRSATIVFVSSVAASLIAVVVASMMYYRTMESMQTANNTSLEALVISLKMSINSRPAPPPLMRRCKTKKS